MNWIDISCQIHFIRDLRIVIGGDDFPFYGLKWNYFCGPFFVLFNLYRLKSKERLNFSPSNFGSPATVTTQVCTIDDLGQSGTSSILEPKAAVDLSDLSSFGDDGGNGAFADELGFTPLTDSYEDTPMVCTPRANSRVVKIVSKHSNVWQS